MFTAISIWLYSGSTVSQADCCDCHCCSVAVKLLFQHEQPAMKVLCRDASAAYFQSILYLRIKFQLSTLENCKADTGQSFNCVSLPK